MSEPVVIPAKVRGARPEGFDYVKSLHARFGAQSMFLRMEYIGTSPERKPYAVVDRVAIIDICGVLCCEAEWWDETEYGEILSEVQMAVADSDVDAILLCVNSPGGQTDMAFETHDALVAAAKLKTVHSVAAPNAYSAAYLLAVVGSVLYTPPITGGVGSVGVYCLHLDFSGYLQELGIKPTFFSAGTGKTDGNPYEPLTKEAGAKFQAEVNRLYGEFVARVATGRKLAESAIIKLGAQIFEGAKAAIGAGFADRAGMPDQALTDLAASAAKAKQLPGSYTAAKLKGETGMAEPQVTPPAPPAQAAAPAVVDAAAARQDGIMYANSILSVCAIAGATDRAAGFIDKNLTVDAVSKILVDERAAAPGAAGGQRSQVLPHEAGAGTAKPEKSLKQLMAERAKREGLI